MPVKIGSGRPPQSKLQRWFFRAPIKLYQWRLGFLLGSRFLLIEHVGRKSGRVRQTVVEVVESEPSAGRYRVCSGYGDHSDWFKNLQQTPAVHITVGRTRMPVTARVLPPDEAGPLMLRYAERHPRLAKALVRACGYEVDGSPADWLALGDSDMRFVEFAPR